MTVRATVLWRRLTGMSSMKPAITPRWGSRAGERRNEKRARRGSSSMVTGSDGVRTEGMASKPCSADRRDRRMVESAMDAFSLGIEEHRLGDPYADEPLGCGDMQPSTDHRSTIGEKGESDR